MVNAPKKNFSPLLAGIYSKSTRCSTQQPHQVNEGKNGIDGGKVRAVGALRSLQAKMRLEVAPS